MITLTKTKDLENFCDYARSFSYITIDTEFLREKTYFAKLCLVQLALPGNAKGNVVLVDPLTEDELSFEPLLKLFTDKGITKVFHAGRQDLEIFYNMGNIIPEPLFDTQIAAMVCGYGEQVSYEILAKKVLNWSFRVKLKEGLKNTYDWISSETNKKGSNLSRFTKS